MALELQETINLDDFRGNPKGVWGLIKNDQLTLEELDRAHEVGFDGAEFDDTNDLHLQMVEGVEASKTRLKEKRAADLAEERRQGRGEAARVLHTEYGVDPATVPVEILDGIYASMLLQQEEAAAAGSEVEHLLSQDNDELVLVDAYDNIIAFVDAPRDDLERRNILEWVGERLTRAQAKQAGLQAEQQFWLDKITKQYGPQINKQNRIIARLDYLYSPVGQAYLDELRKSVEKSNAEQAKKNPKAKPAALPKSVKVGLLTLAYKADSAKVEIEDELKAVEFFRALMGDPERLRALLLAQPEFAEDNEDKEDIDAYLANKDLLASVIKIEPKVMKSQIPPVIKRCLVADQKGAYGLYFYAGGVPQFSMK